MNRSLAVVAALCAFLLLLPSGAGAAADAGKWSGKATSMDRSLKYGMVTFSVKGSTIRDLKIETVPVSGCGGLGYKTVTVPKLKIEGKRFSGSYQPVKGVDDIIVVHGTIEGGTAKGTFNEGPLCEGDGRFTASAK